MQTPCSDYVQTNGLVYFARMLDKIRLHAAGELAPGYYLGITSDPTVFDARITRFLGIDYEALRKRTVEGGSNGEVLEWCFKNGRRPNHQEIEIFNSFLLKR